MAHLVWRLGCFIDSNAALDEPLQILLDRQNTCGAAALFCTLQAGAQGHCHTTHILPGMQAAASFLHVLQLVQQLTSLANAAVATQATLCMASKQELTASPNQLLSHG